MIGVIININIVFFKDVIIVQLTASVLLQFPTCLYYVIMYAKHRIGTVCRRTGGCVFWYGQDCPYFSLSHFTNVLDPHVRAVFNLPPQPPWPAALAEGLPPPPR
jgi:hypothetical protein